MSKKKKKSTTSIFRENLKEVSSLIDVNIRSFSGICKITFNSKTTANERVEAFFDQSSRKKYQKCPICDRLECITYRRDQEKTFSARGVPKYISDRSARSNVTSTTTVPPPPPPEDQEKKEQNNQDEQPKVLPSSNQDFETSSDRFQLLVKREEEVGKREANANKVELSLNKVGFNQQILACQQKRERELLVEGWKGVTEKDAENKALAKELTQKEMDLKAQSEETSRKLEEIIADGIKVKEEKQALETQIIGLKRKLEEEQKKETESLEPALKKRKLLPDSQESKIVSKLVDLSLVSSFKEKLEFIKEVTPEEFQKIEKIVDVSDKRREINITVKKLLIGED